MRRKALALSLMTILLVALVSGCISESKAPTGTVSKAPVQKQSSGTPSSETTTHTGTSTTPVQSTSSSTVTSTPQDPCARDSWRDNFTEQTIICALKPINNRNLNPVFSLSLTGDKTRDALIITDFLVNYVHLDEFVENQSMKKGHYYNIKTPDELFHTKTGTYADMALFGAYALARDGFETYIFYIETKNGFGALPGFKITVDNPWVPNEPFVIFWPLRIPMRLSAALTLLNISGETPKTVTTYRITYSNGEYHVENLGTTPASEFGFSIMEWLTFGAPDAKTMNKLLSQDFPGCRFTFNLSELSSIPDDVKGIKVEIPYGILLYSVPFSQRYTEILYTVMTSNETIVKDLRDCRVLILGQSGDVSPLHPPTNYTAIYIGWVSK